MVLFSQTQTYFQIRGYYLIHIYIISYLHNLSFNGGQMQSKKVNWETLTTPKAKKQETSIATREWAKNYTKRLKIRNSKGKSHSLES